MSGPEPDLERPAFRPLDVQSATDGGRPGLVLADRLGFAEPAFLPAELLPILGRMDGVRTLDEIRAEAEVALGARIDREFVRDLVRQLDERLLLHSPRFRAALADAADSFAAGAVRPCRHAGTAGYARAPELLRAELAAMLPAPSGPVGPVRALVAPHIDLLRGRAGYGAAYGHLLAGEPADLYVLFGTGHQGPTAPVTGLPLDWETPLGRVATDRAFVAAVHAAIGPPDPHDVFLHRDEHSLEFQVLMLQYVAERRGLPPPRVAAFLCGSLPGATADPTGERYVGALLAAFAAAADASGQRVCYVAGADLAHIGPFFGDPESVDAARLRQLEADERARLAHLQRGAPGSFHAAVMADDNRDRVCSATALYLVGALAGGPATLLGYEQAAADDGSQVVGFAALHYPGG